MTWQIGFRVDAGASLGGGHVMRCLTLARGFRTLGHRCCFLVSPETLEVIPTDMWEGFETTTVEGLEAPDGIAPFDLLVIDHYRIRDTQERGWRAVAGRLLVIDDLADRPHDCDLLLDQTYGVWAEDYARLVPDGCRLLLGTDYALLRDEFPALRDEALARRAGMDRVRRLVISLGMTDVGGIAGRVCAAIAGLDSFEAADVVIGGRAASHVKVLELSRRDPRFRVLGDVRNMAELLTHADAAIGAGGTTSWERCALGLPTALVVLADNQKKIAAELASAGAIALVGDVRGMSDADLRSRLRVVLTDTQNLRSAGRVSAALCDGGGMRRVMEELELR